VTCPRFWSRSYESADCGGVAPSTETAARSIRRTQPKLEAHRVPSHEGKGKGTTLFRSLALDPVLEERGWRFLVERTKGNNARHP